MHGYVLTLTKKNCMQIIQINMPMFETKSKITEPAIQ